VLRRRGYTRYSFCKRWGFDRIQLQRLLDGKIRRISIDLADDIERATDGEVPIRAWRVTPPVVPARNNPNTTNSDRSPSPAGAADGEPCPA
jgi:hypothetical protein